MTTHSFAGKRLVGATTYIAVCLILAVAALISTSYVPFFLLALVTAPTSAISYYLSWWGGVMLFGPGESGILAGAFFVVLWMATAGVQLLLARAILDAHRSSRSPDRQG